MDNPHFGAETVAVSGRKITKQKLKKFQQEARKREESEIM